MNLSTLESIQESLEHLENEEKTLEQKINNLLNEEKNYEASMNNFYSRMSSFDEMINDANELSKQINKTSKLSNSVSSKIFILDSTKEKVANFLKRIGDILDLKFCTQNIEKALSNNDYEQAAAHIHRFLSIDEKNLKNFSLNDDLDQNLNSLNEAFKKLHEAESNLRNIILKNFDNAVNSKNKNDVERFFKIFPLLNQHELGLRKYSNYLCRTLDEEIKIKISSETNFISQLKLLFEYTAKMIDFNQPLIETFYGPGNLLYCVKIIQEECDLNSIKIINCFKDKIDLKFLSENIRNLIKTSATNIVRTDPKEIDTYLNDIVLLNSSSELYLNFITERILKDLDPLGKESQDFLKKQNELINLYRNCKLSLSLQELTNTYVLLEEYYLKESSSKAIDLDDLEVSNITSSMLDDTFFIIKKCCKRAISTKSIDVVCAIVNHCVCFLDSSFFDVLSERLRYGYPITPGIANALDLSQAYNVLQSGRYIGNSSDLEKNRLLYLASLNNFDIACKYIKSLKTSILEDSRKEVNILRKQEIEKLEPCLIEFLSINSKFNNVINSGLNNIYKVILKPKIKNWLDAFQNETHFLDEVEIDKYEASEGLRSFTQEFLINIDKLLNSFKPNLTASNYEKLLNIFSADLTTRLEVTVKKCNFNKMGAYQFNRELRALMNYLAASTSWSIRDKFMKIKHICEIINLENLSEFKIIFPDLSVIDLTKNEIEKILKLRVDFTIDQIKKLKI